MYSSQNLMQAPEIGGFIPNLTCYMVCGHGNTISHIN